MGMGKDAAAVAMATRACLRVRSVFEIRRPTRLHPGFYLERAFSAGARRRASAREISDRER